MVAPVQKSHLKPAAGPAATFIALPLAAVLGFALMVQVRERASLEARLTEAQQKAAAAGVYWKTRFAACEASVGAQGPRDGALTRVAEAGPPGDAARRLVSQQPAGFDVCARMESADQAVLSSLK